MTKKSSFDQAEALIRQTGARVTAARVHVLAYLLAQPYPVSHHQVEEGLSTEEKIDRVTLYRTLDSLEAQGLVHKIQGVDRSALYRANGTAVHHPHHAHFRCNSCAKVVCLDDVPSELQAHRLPEGFRGLEVELTVKGFCASCA